MAHPLWPLFDLRLQTGRVELRLPNDDELVELCDVARDGIHPPEEMPFSVAWTDRPSPRFEREFAQHHWLMRGQWRPDDWMLNLAIFVDGRPVGSQSVGAKEFGVLRTVDTGSWIGRAYQRRGFGRESRLAVLALAFDGLGAEAAESAAFGDNLASAGVSRSLGYEPNGVLRMAPRGEAREAVRYRLTRDGWLGRARPAVDIGGLDAALELFGLEPPITPD